MTINPESDERVIEALARKLAESVAMSYTESPRYWRTIATVALNEVPYLVIEAEKQSESEA